MQHCESKGSLGTRFLRGRPCKLLSYIEASRKTDIIQGIYRHHSRTYLCCPQDYPSALPSMRSGDFVHTRASCLLNTSCIQTLKPSPLHRIRLNFFTTTPLHPSTSLIPRTSTVTLNTSASSSQRWPNATTESWQSPFLHRCRSNRYV